MLKGSEDKYINMRLVSINEEDACTTKVSSIVNTASVLFISNKLEEVHYFKYNAKNSNFIITILSKNHVPKIKVIQKDDLLKDIGMDVKNKTEITYLIFLTYLEKVYYAKSMGITNVE